jgi:HEAT repeat protein
MMENDRVNLARNFIKAILKTKKMLQIFPSNNVIYIAAIDEAYALAKEYLDLHGELTLQIKPAEILVDTEQAYQSPGKADNFALFFFKEGIREVIFKEPLSKSELEDFLKLTGTDFDKDDSGDDFLSAAWGRSFENIKFTIDDVAYLESDWNHGRGQDSGPGETLELSGSEGGPSEAEPHSAENASGFGTLFSFGRDMQGEINPDETASGEVYSQGSSQKNSLSTAYQDALVKEDTIAVEVGELTAEERGIMLAEMEIDPCEKSDQLATILVTMIAKSSPPVDAGYLTKALEDLTLFAFRRNDLSTAITALRMIEEIPVEQRGDAGLKVPIANFFSFCRSADVMEKLGSILDSSKEFNEEALQEYAGHLGVESLYSFIALLERLENIHARRMVNNVLIRLGKQNVRPLCEHLKDPTWFVVRNMVYILRNIGDNSVLDEILTVAGHDHPRVRLEVVKALHDFRSVKALQALKEFFDDRDSTVRLSSITVIGAMAKETTGASLFACDAIIAKIREKHFEEREFKEKKSFYETLALLHDRTADEYMMDVLKKKSIFGGRKIVENRACAAHYLGLAKCREALPLLEKLRGSSDTLLREHVTIAIQRISNA